MAYFQHAARHLQTAVEDAVELVLTRRRWLATDGSVPYGATPVVLVKRRLEEQEMRTVKGNMVAIMFGDEMDDDELELGAGLSGTSLAIWVDVVAENDAVGVAIASDIKDMFTGRAPDFSRFLVVRDFTNDREGLPVAGWRAEFVNVIRHRPQVTDWRKFWQVVNATLSVEFPEQTALVPFSLAPQPVLTSASAGTPVVFDVGTWNPPAAFTYRWLADGLLVGTAPVFVPGPADVGAQLVLQVTASAVGRTTEIRSSAPLVVSA